MKTLNYLFQTIQNHHRTLAVLHLAALMRCVKKEMELDPVHVCQSTLVIHILDVDQNAYPIRIVTAIRPVQTIDAKTLAQGLVE